MNIVYNETNRTVLVNGCLFIWYEGICESILDIIEEYCSELPMNDRMNILKFFSKF